MRWTKALVGAAIAMGAANVAHASVEISAAPTSGISCSAGVCAPTAKKAVLNAADLANMLATSDVKVTTGSGAVTITVTSSFSWTSASRLTLDAAQTISFKAPVSVAGPGAVTIVTNDGGSGGQLIFFETGRLDFWNLSSSLVINGDSYTLAGDLKTLAADIASNSAGSFALASDYDARQDGVYKRSPVPVLNGTFEGLGHTLSNLMVSEKSCDQDQFIGLFAIIGTNGGVRDFNLGDANVGSMRPHYVGAIAGANSGTIANVSVSGAVYSTSGAIADCKVVGAAGGVVAASSGTIVNAHSSASVTVGELDSNGYSYAGGIAASATMIDLSSATGPVSNAGTGAAGGLAGIGDHISRSFATGAAGSGSNGDNLSSVGGLVGSGGDVVNSYASGSASGGCGGGLAGAGGDISSSYATGPAGGQFAGGFVGCNNGGVDASDYWDADTDSQTAGCGTGGCSGITGLSDAQLKSALPPGFDKTIWARSKTINHGYPYLIDNPPQ
jgi:hypothetical protein